MNRRVQKRLVWLGCAVILFCAVVPNALYVEHWPGLPWSQTIDSVEEVGEHAAHCHGGGQESCSETAAFGQALPIDVAAGLMLAIGVYLLAVAFAPSGWSEVERARLRRPPRLIPS